MAHHDDGGLQDGGRSEEALERLVYWIVERHRIWRKREMGVPKPWTDDPVLQSYFFTHPYRERDKTTVWFREHLREPWRDLPEVVFTTVAFRWFNYVPTGELLADEGLFERWVYRKARSVLFRRQKEAGKLFTGAYIIKSPDYMDKVTGICQCISNVWVDRGPLVKVMERHRTLEEGWRKLLEFPYLGGFMAYEVISDLRHTYLYESAEDIHTWCNLGPGAKRGLNRLRGVSLGETMPRDWRAVLEGLLAEINVSLPKEMPRFEMRDLEHSLCEFDKYERARLGQGVIKRRYNGK